MLHALTDFTFLSFKPLSSRAVQKLHRSTFYILFIKCLWWHNKKQETEASSFAKYKPDCFLAYKPLKHKVCCNIPQTEDYLRGST